MISKAFARACRKACLRFSEGSCSHHKCLHVGPEGIKKLRKHVSQWPEHETCTERFNA